MQIAVHAMHLREQVVTVFDRGGSMSPAQMQAKYGYDKEPWRCKVCGVRTELDATGFWHTSVLFPRPECIPQPDPLPYIFSGMWRSPVWHPEYFYRPRPWGTFSPDPAYVRPVFNPILSAFRDVSDADIHHTARDTAQSWLLWWPRIKRQNPATPAQVAKARTVLTRLAVVVSDPVAPA
jgi:hypothetical protein